MISTLLEINFYLLVLSILYLLLKRWFTANMRRVLIVVLPFLAFFCTLVKTLLIANSFHIILPTVEVFGNVQTSQFHEFSFSDMFSGHALLFIYYTGVFFFSILALINILKIYRYFRTAQFLPEKDVYVSVSDLPLSFSFLNFIHLSNSLPPNQREIVLEHEEIHVKMKHTYDLLFMQFVHILCWFNPILFFLKKDLIAVHEYQVDQQMYTTHQNKYVSYLVASSLGVNSSQLVLTSQFYNGLKLTQRVIKMKTKMKNKWTIVAIIPAFAVLLSLVSFDSKKEVISTTDIVVQDSVYNKVEQIPEYPGGHKAMVDFIVNHIKYPEVAKKNGVEGTVYVMFVVKKTGKLADFSIGNKTDEDLGNEALRVIKLMPKWTPGEQDGKKVDVQYTLPIKFKLPE